MGRKKLMIKRIEDKNSRHATFFKRRNGLMKKARELSILCDVEIVVIVFSSSGKLYQFCSSGNLLDFINKYKSHIEGDAKVYQGENASWKSYADLMQMVEMQLEGPNVEKLSVEDLENLENKVNVALANIRAEKERLMLDTLKALQEEEIRLKEENDLLLREKEYKGSRARTYIFAQYTN